MNDQCKVSRFSRKKPDTSMAEVHETTSRSYVHTVILWNGSWRKTTPNNQTSEKKMSQTLIETRSQISKPTACLKSDYCPPQWQQLLWQSIFDFWYSYGLRYKCCKYAIPKFSRHKACEHYSASQLQHRSKLRNTQKNKLTAETVLCNNGKFGQKFSSIVVHACSTSTSRVFHQISFLWMAFLTVMADDRGPFGMRYWNEDILQNEQKVQCSYMNQCKCSSKMDYSVREIRSI